MATRGKAQDEGQQPEGQPQSGEQPQDATQAAPEGGEAAEQAGGDAAGGEQSGDGEPADSRGDAKKSGASPSSSGKAKRAERPVRATPKVTPATLAARQAQVFAAPAMKAPMHEKHLGVVNRRGEPVDLEQVIVKDVPAGSTMRATEVLYEETTVPGADDKTRRRILYGKDAIVPELEFRDLLAAVTERAAVNKAEK
jgi:hypothetical protein